MGFGRLSDALLAAVLKCARERMSPPPPLDIITMRARDVLCLVEELIERRAEERLERDS